MPATWPTVYRGALSSSMGRGGDMTSGAALDPLVRGGIDGHGGGGPARHLDLARLGALGDGQLDLQDAVVVAGVDAVGVEAVTEEQLAAEGAVRPLADQVLDPVDGAA